MKTSMSSVEIILLDDIYDVFLVDNEDQLKIKWIYVHASKAIVSQMFASKLVSFRLPVAS